MATTLRRTARVTLRFRSDELAAIVAAARADGFKRTEWIREILLAAARDRRVPTPRVREVRGVLLTR